MDRGYFHPPVSIELPSDRIGVCRNVTSAAEAAEILLYRWPEKRGRRHQEALRVCLAVLEGQEPANAVRQALIDAAGEAGVHVRQ
ncbi:DUF982 domain-containing protein [Brucella sp. SA075A]